MFLHRFTASQSVQLFGEDSLSTANFEVGANCGASKVVSIEATALGIIIRREKGAKDLFINSPGIGQLLEKVAPEPTQLKAAREGK